MAYDGDNVVTHTLFQHFRRDQLSLFVCMEPLGALRMPYKSMTMHLESGSQSLIHELISKGKVIDSLFRMNDLTLHTVLSHHPVEMLYDILPVGSLVAAHHSRDIMLIGRICHGSHLPLVYADAGAPIVPISVLQSLCPTGQRGKEKKNCCHC